jgi:hypothetical protein
MSEPTDEAMRAAQQLPTDEAMRAAQQLVGGFYHRDRQSGLAEVIDRETNLPALKAENARLREALIEVRHKLQSLSHLSMDRAVYIGVGIALSTICEALATSDE